MNALSTKRRPVRVLVDVVGDLTHFGHTNAFRQAKQFGDIVVAGVHPDEEILKHKHCSPVFNHVERCELIRHLRYVDEVIEDLRYDYTLVDLDKYQLDLNVHGNEVTVDASGKKLYEDIQDAGRYKLFPRTDGICTTDVIEKILKVYSSTDHLNGNWSASAPDRGGPILNRNHMSPEALCCRPIIFDEANLFLQFPQLLETYQQLFKSAKKTCLARDVDSNDPFLLQDQFVSVIRVPHAVDSTVDWQQPQHSGTLVYVQGDFDIFSIGHLRFLLEASRYGDQLLVGITPDFAIKSQKGPGYPLNNAYQRALSVMGYRCVTGVLLLPGAKSHPIETAFIRHYGITTVCVGEITYRREKPNGDEKRRYQQDPFEVPRAMGILRVINSGSTVTTSVVVGRILRQKEKYIERNTKKLTKGISTIS